MEVRLMKSDLYCDLEPLWSDEKEIDEYVKQLENDSDMEDTYKEYMVTLLTINARFNPSKRKLEEVGIHERDDDYNQEENDPQYEMFLQNLEEHDKSYVLKHKINGSCVLIKYEEESDSYDDSDPDPRRKLRPRGTSNQKPDREIESGQGLDPQRKLKPCGPSNRKPDRENESGQGQQRPRKLRKPVGRSQRKCVNTAREENVEAIRCSNDLTVTPTDSDYSHFLQNIEDRKPVRRSQRKCVNTAREENVEATRRSNDLTPMPTDTDYSLFLQNLEDDGDHQIFTRGSCAIVYEKDGPDVTTVKQENNDGDSGLKILDNDPYCSNENLRPSENLREEANPEMQLNFRREIMRILRKPYDKEEYNKLWQDITVCKPVSHHKELRDGRDVEYLTDKAGKSHLQRHPDFERALLRFEHDKPRRLNLLRGFFFWLEHLPLEGSFMPWKDPLCVAMEPRLQPPTSCEGKSKRSKCCFVALIYITNFQLN